eukprot:1604892-Amphidinium_carterae.1
MPTPNLRGLLCSFAPVADAEIIKATRGTRLSCCSSACLVVIAKDLNGRDLVLSEDGTGTLS